MTTGNAGAGMLKRLVVAALWAGLGYVIGAAAGGYLISTFSANRHDRSVEAAMTALFVFGPAAAVVSFIVAMIRSRPR